DPRMVSAIGQAGDRVAAAEKEIAAAGIADRPAAGLLVQFQDGAALADRADVLDQLRFGLQVVIVGMRQCGIAADRCATDGGHWRCTRKCCHSPRRMTPEAGLTRICPRSHRKFPTAGGTFCPEASMEKVAKAFHPLSLFLAS